MQDLKKGRQGIAMAWSALWKNLSFKRKTIIYSSLLVAILVILPLFFSTIEKRNGIQLNDPILQLIPAVDVSLATFLVIWSMTLFIWVRMLQNPSLFLVTLCSMVVLFLSRLISISLLPLDPPVGLIPLKDPIVNLFYGGTDVFITKDLFYSGHTSTQFLFFLCLPKRRDKLIALAATVAVATLVLVQHVHYTIDVVFAFVFTWPIYLLGKRLAKH
jgi:hypothetical protein